MLYKFQLQAFAIFFCLQFHLSPVVTGIGVKLEWIQFESGKMQTRATPNTDAFHAVHFMESFDSFFHSSTMKYQHWRAVWKMRCYKSIYYQPMLWWDYVLKSLDNTRSFVPVFVQIWITCNQNLFTLSSFTRSLLPTVFLRLQ